MLINTCRFQWGNRLLRYIVCCWRLYSQSQPGFLLWHCFHIGISKLYVFFSSWCFYVLTALTFSSICCSQNVHVSTVPGYRACQLQFICLHHLILFYLFIYFWFSLPGIVPSLIQPYCSSIKFEKDLLKNLQGHKAETTWFMLKLSLLLG